MKKNNIRRIAAVVGIILLVLMYAVNLVLALIGTEESRDLLKITLTVSIFFPFVLYGMLVLMKKSSFLNPGAEKPLTDEEYEEAKRRIKEQKKTEEERKTRRGN